MILRIGFEISDRDEHSFLDETHGIPVVLDLYPTLVSGGYACELVGCDWHEGRCDCREAGLESAVEVCEVSRCCLFEHPRSRSSAPGTCSCRIQSVAALDCSLAILRWC